MQIDEIECTARWDHAAARYAKLYFQVGLLQTLPLYNFVHDPVTQLQHINPAHHFVVGLCEAVTCVCCFQQRYDACRLHSKAGKLHSRPSPLVRLCEAVICWQTGAACGVCMHAVERSIGDDCGDADDLNRQDAAGVPAGSGCSIGVHSSFTALASSMTQPLCVTSSASC